VIRIKSERAQAGLSQEELSEKLGVSRITVSNWENGRGIIPASSISKMATEIFGCTTDWLLGLTDERL
jgi:transcriptional regulator with XRE-family HTH domain